MVSSNKGGMYDGINTTHSLLQRSGVNGISQRQFDFIGREDSRCALRISHQAARSFSLRNQPGYKVPPNISRRASNQYHHIAPLIVFPPLSSISSDKDAHATTFK